MVSPPPPRPVHPFFQLSSAQSKRKRQAGLAAADSTRKGHNTPTSTGQGSKENTPFRAFKAEYQGNGKQDADERLDSTDDGINEKEAIEVLESTPSPVKPKALPAPKNLGFGPGTGKAAHPFFSQAHFQSGHGTPTLLQEDSAPVLNEGAGVVETATVPVRLTEQPPKVHSFFRMNTLDREKGNLKSGWGKEEREAPLPMGQWPNHVGSYVTPASERRWIGKRRGSAPAVKDDGFWEGVVTRASTPVYPEVKLKADEIPIFPHIAKHPSFLSIPFKCSSSSSNRALWSDRYRPLRTSEVIGNEVEATYLRDWLSALAVGGQHGRGSKVVRQVIKKPKSALIDGFIVDDLGLYGGAPNSEVDVENENPHLEDLPDPPISHDLNARPNNYPSLASRLANTILLTGPTGSGKTAAVYAAAHELGWEVFEVYVGMGKRTGANLMKWVGELGKNHTVLQQDGKLQKVIDDNEKRRKSKAREKGLSSFFDKGSFKFGKVSSSQGLANDPIDIESNDEGDKILVNEVASVSEGESGIRFKDSLLLIDEADILFEEEGSFWPAVIALASESRRPIVLTCNGQIPQRSCVKKLETREEDRKKDDLQLMAQKMEVISFSDAFIDVRPRVLMELYDADKLQPTSDEELEVAGLLKPEMDETYPILAMIDRSSEIADSLVQAVGGYLSPFGDLGLARAKYIRSILSLLDPLTPLSEPLLPHSSLFIHTLPTIQSILSADDIFETLEQQAVDRGDERINPKTGKPMRRGAEYTYTRYWDLEGAEDEARGISRLIW
ncbi:hypothetical protein I307_02122 [Cryptococcus deuterogattii 99/473]|uniref:AAA+ ATPase domain-containing protein n=1 Tax=Cryptococcus deuterogattii Ram5 TaxID=1296110 RepID=A0A0D0T4G1_9TREE|nr:hypothetical protein I313_03343 [Cryptococcus deuterogattii Ram5]KIS01152.1 hypothetical protein L804_01021 [Cryptococcus deuterogattii 2001/935-1]KIY58323.1 hypothetical protein I307_02122 [Cryptococcus deuterogattii 99/473]